jgi:hypothetical protein
VDSSIRRMRFSKEDAVLIPTCPMQADEEKIKFLTTEAIAISH